MVRADVKAGYDLGTRKGPVNHLLFMDDLKLYALIKHEIARNTTANTVQIFSQGLGMELGISKCGISVIKNGKYEFTYCEGMHLSLEKEIKEIYREEGYKYLGLLKADGVKDSMMKERLGKEYIGRIRKILKSKLNGVKRKLAINSYAVAVIRHSAGVIKWIKEELQKPRSKDKKVVDDIPGIPPQGRQG